MYYSNFGWLGRMGLRVEKCIKNSTNSVETVELHNPRPTQPNPRTNHGEGEIVEKYLPPVLLNINNSWFFFN